jgi:plasmid stabilization system protein ParE
MEPSIVFHRLVQRDMDGIQRYYLEEAGESVADRFFQLFLSVVERAASNPKRYHPISTALRRATIPGFPYHFLYRETASGIRVLVLRHDRRHPSFGLRRQ